MHQGHEIQAQLDEGKFFYLPLLVMESTRMGSVPVGNALRKII